MYVQKLKFLSISTYQLVYDITKYELPVSKRLDFITWLS